MPNFNKIGLAVRRVNRSNVPPVLPTSEQVTRTADRLLRNSTSPSDDPPAVPNAQLPPPTFEQSSIRAAIDMLKPGDPNRGTLLAEWADLEVQRQRQPKAALSFSTIPHDPNVTPRKALDAANKRIAAKADAHTAVIEQHSFVRSSLRRRLDDLDQKLLKASQLSTARKLQTEREAVAEELAKLPE